MTTRSRLPEFDAPPVAEVVLGVQSAKLSVTTPYLGIYWSEVREQYPDVEVHPALDPVIERFGSEPQTIGTPPGFRLMTKPETPRCWFVDKTGSRLIQLQEDRLIHNWRRVSEEEPYPHYSGIRETFSGEYQRLASFVQKQEGRAGELSPEWCEVTYINHIQSVPGRQGLGHLSRVFTFVAPPLANGFLPPPDFGEFGLAYAIRGANDQIGRLHARLGTAIRRKDGAPLLRFELTARGLPEGDGLDGVLAFMDRAHEHIVRGFTELTTPEMHSVWRRIDG
jgi:uncharacterized protein (TIGR04255 family)